MLLIAGDCDPVGDYGSGVRKVWAMLGDAGVRDLTCQIFEEGRHELHNETNRDEVFDYVLTWIEDHISRRCIIQYFLRQPGGGFFLFFLLTKLYPTCIIVLSS